jgi:BMFP domain-containing protein YqiC
MNTVARAWDALMRALAEASELHRGGADANSIAELLQHARELLDIIQQEMADQAVTLPGDARAVLAQLRGRLESLERDLKPVRH